MNELLKFKKFVVFCITLCITLMMSSGVLAKSIVTMKVSGSTATVRGTQIAETYIMFKQLAELYSNFEIEVNIFPQGTYGGSQEAVLAVRNGECHMFNQASNNFAVHAPSVFPFSMPYMFESFEELQAVVDGPFGKEISDRVVKEAGVRLVGLNWAGWRAVTNSVKPIKKLEDLQGLKIRVPKSPTIFDTFKAWGVNPVAIGWNETFTALQQGVADGFDNPVMIIGSAGFYEVQKYCTTLKYNPQIATYIVNEQFWQGLSPQHKVAIERALKEATEWEHGYIRWSTERYTKICKDKGMIFYDLPTGEEARWKEKALDAWPKMKKIAGGEEWVQKFQNEVLKMRKKLAQ
jgi:tripartite ATP-independent transporter DctP family solute receptor